jgi:hypothetical protein
VAFLVEALRDADPNPCRNQESNHNRQHVFRWRRYYGRRFERHTEVRGEYGGSGGIKGQQTSQSYCDNPTSHNPIPPSGLIDNISYLNRREADPKQFTRDLRSV